MQQVSGKISSKIHTRPNDAFEKISWGVKKNNKPHVKSHETTIHTPHKKSITCFRKNELLKDQKNDIIFGLKHNSIIENKLVMFKYLS